MSFFDEFVAHDHARHNHQALANQIISPEAGHLGASGGMLNYYYRAAA